MPWSLSGRAEVAGGARVDGETVAVAGLTLEVGTPSLYGLQGKVWLRSETAARRLDAASTRPATWPAARDGGLERVKPPCSMNYGGFRNPGSASRLGDYAFNVRPRRRHLNRAALARRVHDFMTS